MRPSVVETLVHSAWRRSLLIITAEQSAFALLIVCSGAIVMLLTGTQILAWYWLALLAGVGLAFSGWRIQQHLLRRYDVARIIDDRLQLSDSVSTAWYLLAESPGSEGPAAQHQIHQAEQIAAGIEPDSAFPFVLSRMWLATLALILVIFFLFAARYLVNSTLSLKPALIHFDFSTANSPGATALEKQKTVAKSDAKGEPVRELLSGAPRDTQSESLNKPSQNTIGDSRSEQNANASAGGKSSQAPQPNDGQPPARDGAENSHQSDSGDNPTDSNPAQGSKEASNPSQDKGRSEPKTADGQQTPGLMDKMRDALSGLMAKLRQNSGTDAGSRDANGNSDAQKGRNQQNASGKKQNATAEQSGQKAQNSMDSQASTQAAAVEKTPASSIGASNEETPQSKTNQPQSGAGRQDGQKDIKEAEQLKAMGKLAEIIGKRSASLTGEIKVDKPTEEQQLETQYSNQTGRHSDSGGEINRDEVPAEYQSYVRTYMKEVHKQANSK
jgi:hypothetical protein